MGVPEEWGVRVGDAERQAVVDQLRVHLGAGRLTVTEFEERAGDALAARTHGDLVPLTADLPDVKYRPSGPPVRVSPPKVRSQHPSDVAFRVHVATWASLAVFFVLIWFFTGGDYYFWPIWPILGTGLPVMIHAATRRAKR